MVRLRKGRDNCVAKILRLIFKRNGPNETGAVESPAMKRALALVPLVTVLATLLSCEKPSDDAKPPHEDWIIESRVVFLEADRRTPRERPNERLRLWVPYIVGDFYGSNNEGEISPVDLRANLTFTMNLNLGYNKLARVLVPTEFSEKWMSIEPRTIVCSSWVFI